MLIIFLCFVLLLKIYDGCNKTIITQSSIYRYKEKTTWISKERKFTDFIYFTTLKLSPKINKKSNVDFKNTLRLKCNIVSLLQAELDFFDNKFFKFTRLSENATKIFDLHLKYVLKYLENGETVLDIGCNDGRHTLFLRKNGYKVFGLELSKKAIKRSRDKFFAFGSFLEESTRKPFICGDAYHLPTKVEKFDAVLLLETLHHLPDKEIVLKNICDILKPRGKVIISEPNPNNLMRSIGNYIGKRFSFLSPNETPTSIDEIITVMGKYFRIKKAFFYLNPISISTVFIYEAFINIANLRSKLIERGLSVLYKLTENFKTENIRIGKRLMWRIFVVGEKTNQLQKQ